ncbi:MAG: helix-hairpin-helix domain-containing protein, partial [Lentisphaeria bacterium]
VKAFELSFDEQLNQAVEDLASVDGVDHDTAKKLVNAGFLSVAGLKAANIDDLTAIEGITAEQAMALKEAVSGM